MKNASWKFILILSITFLFSNYLNAQSGTLDLTFNASGRVTVPNGTGNSMAIQSDGKIVMAGYAQTQTKQVIEVARYNINGSLDSTFNNTGIVTTSIDANEDGVNSVAIQTDGKIVVGGYSNNYVEYFAIVRYNTDGTLDNTFNGNGIVISRLLFNAKINKILIQSDGKLLAAGSGVDNSGNITFALERYNSNGTIDNTFNGNGIILTSFGPVAEALSAALQPDGKIILGGYGTSNTTGKYEFALARYNTIGTLDSSFNGNGKLTTIFDSSSNQVAYGITLQTDNKILACGGKDNPGKVYAVARYNSDGSLDNTFNGTGKVTTSFSNYNKQDVANDITIQNNNKIIVCGSSYQYTNATGNNYSFAIVRYNIDGSLDNTFNGNGIVTTNFLYADSYAYSVKLFGNRIYLGGTSSGRFAITAYQNDTLPRTNTFSGKVYLQGAYNTTTDSMNNTLNTLGVLQANAATQPYNAIYGYAGTESVSSTFFASHPDIVDWVLVELRDPTTPSTVVATRAVFVKQDGTLVDTSGTNNQISFSNIVAGSYYVSIRHRNHLGVRSTGTIDFSTGAGSYDFSTSASQSFQNQSYTSTVQTGIRWSMRAGNANFNNNVKYNGPGNDENQILNIKLGGSLSNILNNVYSPEDVNMNGNVKWNGPGNDQNYLLNILLGGSLSIVFLEQLF